MNQLKRHLGLISIGMGVIKRTGLIAFLTALSSTDLSSFITESGGI